MAELTTRPYHDTDAEALAELLNAVDRAAGGHPGYTVEEVRSFATTLVRDPATDSRVVVTGDGAIVAGAMVATPPDGGFRVDLSGGVRPEWQGRGLGRDLLAWQIDRAREIHADRAPTDSWETHADALLGNDSALRLFERLGLTPARYWFDMVAPTRSAEELPASPLPAGLTVATYQADREKDLHEAHMEAFLDHWGFQRRALDEWAPLSVRSEDFLPDLSLLALDGHDIAGYVLSYRDTDPKRIYLGQVGVRRPWRRRGLAAALLSQVLARAARDGFDMAWLGVDADSPTGAGGVYERVGFRNDHRAVTYSLELPPAEPASY